MKHLFKTSNVQLISSFFRRLCATSHISEIAVAKMQHLFFCNNEGELTEPISFLQRADMLDFSGLAQILSTNS